MYSQSPEARNDGALVPHLQFQQQPSAQQVSQFVRSLAQEEVADASVALEVRAAEFVRSQLGGNMNYMHQLMGMAHQQMRAEAEARDARNQAQAQMDSQQLQQQSNSNLQVGLMQAQAASTQQLRHTNALLYNTIEQEVASIRMIVQDLHMSQTELLATEQNAHAQQNILAADIKTCATDMMQCVSRFRGIEDELRRSANHDVDVDRGMAQLQSVQQELRGILERVGQQAQATAQQLRTDVGKDLLAQQADFSYVTLS